jgi:hypothetical protein
MKRLIFCRFIFSLLLLLGFWHIASAQGVSKMIKSGSFWAKVVDSGDEGEGSWGWGMSPSYYDGFMDGLFSSKAMFLGCKDFTDSLGVIHNTYVAGHGQWNIDDSKIWIPVPDQDGYTIHRYLRNQPPQIMVDGLRLEDPFPFNPSDEVAPEKIPGNADVMVESFINTEMGISIHQRVLAWSEKNHDDYQIYEWTFKNTGNVDLDETIELNQTLEDVYFIRQLRYWEDPKPWVSSYGWMPGDSLRILYSYPGSSADATYDIFGFPDEETGFLYHPWLMGEAILFGSDAINPMQDDPNQPRMTGVQDCDLVLVTEHSNNLTESQRVQLYELMENGFSGYDGTPDIEDSKPGHHSIIYDERGFNYPTDAEWFGFTLSGFYACGPYALAPGDSFKVVWAQVMGMISPVMGYEIGRDWIEGECEWGDMEPGGATDILPPPYQEFPNLYEGDTEEEILNNWAKDNWVFTGKDSIFQNATAAQWNFLNNYTVPEAPPAPSLTVESLPDRVRLIWGNESEAAADFAGYRVYRATGDWYPHIPEDGETLIGEWEMVFECGAGTDHALTNQWDDITAVPNVAYFYSVTAFDDGSNNVDFNGRQESLESGFFLNMTTRAAYLTTQPAATMEDIIIVPNPFNFAATEKNFPGEPNKIVFKNLPIECTIKIYTESGDLVHTIEHYGSGDADWGDLPEQHMITRSDQRVVSGIYIAYFETPDGKTAVRKFVIVR